MGAVISLQRLRRCSGPHDFSNTPPYDGHVTRCCVVEWLIIHAYAEGDTAAMSVAVVSRVFRTFGFELSGARYWLKQ